MRKLGILLAASILAILLFWLISPEQEFTSAHAEDFDGFIAALMAEESIPGVAIAVIKRGQVIRLEGRGFADVASQRPMTADTLL